MHSRATSFFYFILNSLEDRRQLEDIFYNPASDRMGDFSLYIYSKEKDNRKENGIQSIVAVKWWDNSRGIELYIHQEIISEISSNHSRH